MASVNYNIGFTLEKRDKGFRFKDLSVPVTKNKNNFDITALKDVEAIKNSFMNIFTWNRGERILNPEFGNPFVQFLYEPMNERTAERIGVAVKSAVARWEPRVNVDKVQVISDEDSNEYNVKIEYSIPSLGQLSDTYLMTLGRPS